MAKTSPNDHEWPTKEYYEEAPCPTGVRFGGSATFHEESFTKFGGKQLIRHVKARYHLINSDEHLNGQALAYIGGHRLRDKKMKFHGDDEGKMRVWKEFFVDFLLDKRYPMWEKRVPSHEPSTP